MRDAARLAVYSANDFLLFGERRTEQRKSLVVKIREMCLVIVVVVL
jgi:hypothetical protein